MTARALCAAWIQAKAAEQAAKDERRQIEDQLLVLGASQVDEFQIDITNRSSYRIDEQKLQTLASEAGLQDHLPALFRWRPELNLKNWQAADKAITGPLLDAITAEDGRPSFKITQNKKESL